MGNRDSCEDWSGSALLTQPAETRNTIGANPFNPPPALGFATQGLPPASAELAGYKNSGPPSLSRWSWVLVPAGHLCGGGSRGQATKDKTSTHNNRRRESSIPGADPASGESEAHGKENGVWPRNKKEGKGPFLSAGRGRLNKANKKRSPN